MAWSDFTCRRVTKLVAASSVAGVEQGINTKFPHIRLDGDCTLSVCGLRKLPHDSRKKPNFLDRLWRSTVRPQAADLSSHVLDWIGNVSCCGLDKSLSKRWVVKRSEHRRIAVVYVWLRTVWHCNSNLAAQFGHTAQSQFSSGTFPVITSQIC
jgi:hypothetical protein